MLSLLLAASVAMPIHAQAQSLDSPALVIIRFNQPRVYFDQQLYSAISKAVAIKPEVMFDVVSYAPATGDGETDRKWQAIAGHNTQSVIAAMKDIGVPMSRINVTGMSQSGIRYDETQVFVR